MSTACHLALEDAGKKVGRRGERAAETPALTHSSLLSTPGRRVSASRCGPGLQRRPRRRRADGRDALRLSTTGRRVRRCGHSPSFPAVVDRPLCSCCCCRRCESHHRRFTLLLSLPLHLQGCQYNTPPWFFFFFSEACALTVHITGSNDRRRGGPGTGLQSAPRRGSPSTVTGVARPLFR